MEIFSIALHDISTGINITRRRIENIRFTDDTLILTVENLTKHKYKKTKHMIISKISTLQKQPYINNQKI